MLKLIGLRRKDGLCISAARMKRRAATYDRSRSLGHHITNPGMYLHVHVPQICGGA